MTRDSTLELIRGQDFEQKGHFVHYKDLEYFFINLVLTNLNIPSSKYLLQV